MNPHPALQGLVTYATDLERAAAEHPEHLRRLLAEAADAWSCLGRGDHAVALLARLVGRRRGRRRPVPLPACLRARSKA